jgi:ATP phosphoribosyltransferase
MPQQRLRIALQKSGRLSKPSLALLKACGLKFSWRNKLISRAEGMAIEALLVRDDDIPSLVADGMADMGVVGENLVAEHRLASGNPAGSPKSVSVALPLGFGHCRLMIAVRHGMAYDGPQSLNGTTIATTYPALVADFLNRHGVRAGIVQLSGSVEIAARLGMADVVCDLVVTGSTLEEHALRPTDTILSSQAVLIRNDTLSPEKLAIAAQLMQRLRGVLAATETKYIMLHAPVSQLATIKALLPGSKSPTILALEGIDDVVALHAVCRESVFWETMEQLKAAGASSILVIPIEKMLD